MNTPCPFCNIAPDRIVEENSLAVAILDNYPVSEGHTLIVPREHSATLFELSAQTQAAPRSQRRHPLGHPGQGEVLDEVTKTKKGSGTFSLRPVLGGEKVPDPFFPFSFFTFSIFE